MKDLSNYRISYDKFTLDEGSLSDDPLLMFRNWFDEVNNSNLIKEPNAMTLSTIDEYNSPSNRVVLLKKFSSSGFIFYTNYNSNKGKNILSNSNVCLSFFWPSHERQIIIKGKCSIMSDEESDKYFYSRPIDSQIGAIASDQSSEIPDRKFIENKFNKLKKTKTKLNRPKQWGGIIVSPFSLEFWQGRKNRLHDRIFYKKNYDGEWSYKRLSP